MATINEIIQSAVDRVKLKGSETWIKWSFWTRAKDVELNSGKNVETAVSELDENISNEIDRATDRENEIETALNSEITRAKSAESTLSTSINNEITRAKNAESTLETNKVPITRTINGKALSSDITLSASDVGADASGSANTALTNAKAYTDTKVADLVNSAPETLDTLGEIADALKDNADIVDVLNESITTKANASDLTSHASNNTAHITADERTAWNAKADGDHTHNYAGSSSAGGAATTAVALTTSAGSATQPVYFSGGKPVACTYTLGKSVPSNAVFTDTTYSTGTASSSGLTKLYAGTGTATDGSMTQNAITTALNGKAPSSHTHSYLDTKGVNTITSTTDDTTAKWYAQNNSIHIYNTEGILTNQPSRYGLLLNICYSGEVHQLWMTQSSGDLAHRGGNASGWDGTWRTILDSSNYKTYCTPANIGADASGSANTALTNAKAYTDTKVADLVGAAPETLDTLEELADALKDNADIVDVLNESITSKASAVDLTSHTGNTTVHITSTERTNWNDANSKKHTHSNKSILDSITSALVDAWNSAYSHISDTVKHITADERATWNAKADGDHTHNYAGSSSAGGAATSLSYFKNTSNIDVGLTDVTANAIGYVSGTSSILGQDDGALYKQVYNDKWSHEIYADYRTGQIALRGMNYGTWQAWRTVLDSSNYKTYCTPANIGAAASSHTHNYLPLAGGDMNGVLNTQNLIPNNAYRLVGNNSNPYYYGYFKNMCSNIFNITDSSNNSVSSISYDTSTDTMYYSANNVNAPFSDVVGLSISSGMYYNMRLYGKNIRLESKNYISSNTAIAMASDEKVKSFTEDIAIDEEKLVKLFDIIKPKSYNYKYLKSDSVNIGFSAQEIEQAMIDLDIDPEKYGILNIQYNHIVSRGSDFEDGKYYTKFYEISYNDLFNLALLKTHMMEKEHVERLVALEEKASKLDELEARLSALENK